jgi:hypothetical protein
MSSENTQFFLAGDIYLDIFDANYQPTGLIGPMNGELLSMQPQSNRIDQMSKMRDTYGQVRNSVLIPQPSEIKLTLRDVPSDVLAAAFMGDVATLSEGAATVTDEPVTARLGKWASLPNRNLDSNSVTVTDSTGATTFAEGTDYQINYRSGLIRAISGGNITDGQALLVDYTASAVAGERVSTMTVSQMKARILVDGVNMADQNRQVHAEIYRATLAPDQALDLLAEQHATVSFTGTMETPTGKTSPAHIDTLS